MAGQDQRHRHRDGEPDDAPEPVAALPVDNERGGLQPLGLAVRTRGGGLRGRHPRDRGRHIQKLLWNAESERRHKDRARPQHGP